MYSQIFSKNELDGVARDILVLLEKNHTDQGASIAALTGELGAGKTTLTQTLAHILGVTENVASPTFVIMKLYNLSYPEWTTLVHIDAYRLNSAEELLKLGWKELIKDPANLILIEWPEQVPGIIPDTALHIFLEHMEEEHRTIKIV